MCVCIHISLSLSIYIYHNTGRSSWAGRLSAPGRGDIIIVINIIVNNNNNDNNNVIIIILLIPRALLAEAAAAAAAAGDHAAARGPDLGKEGQLHINVFFPNLTIQPRKTTIFPEKTTPQHVVQTWGKEGRLHMSCFFSDCFCGSNAPWIHGGGSSSLEQQPEGSTTKKMSEVPGKYQREVAARGKYQAARVWSSSQGTVSKSP